MGWKKFTILAVIALALIAVAVYTTFVHPPRCESFECFSDHMRECDKANYLNEDAEATWQYQIQGIQGGACVVEVKFLQSKTGELGVQKLAGYSMQCGFPKGIVTYPEKDLELCHGRLKEELQGIIIERLHTYIVDNLGEIDQTLDLIVQ